MSLQIVFIDLQIMCICHWQIQCSSGSEIPQLKSGLLLAILLLVFNISGV